MSLDPKLVRRIEGTLASPAPVQTKQHKFDVGDSGGRDRTEHIYKDAATAEHVFITKEHTEDLISDSISSSGGGAFTVVTNEAEFTAALENPLILDIYDKRVSLDISSSKVVNVTSSKNIYGGEGDLIGTGSMNNWNLTFPSSGGVSDITISFYVPISYTGNSAISVAGGYVGSPNYKVRYGHVQFISSSATNASIEYERVDSAPSAGVASLIMWSGRGSIGKLESASSGEVAINSYQHTSQIYLDDVGKPKYNPSGSDFAGAKFVGAGSIWGSLFIMATAATSRRKLGLCFGGYFDSDSATDWYSDGSALIPSKSFIDWDGRFTVQTGVVNGSNEIAWTDTFSTDKLGNIVYPSQIRESDIYYIMDASGTTNIDPGSGRVRMNNSNALIVTEIYISDSDANLADRASTWKTSNSIVSSITIRDREFWVKYSISGRALIAGYTRLTVSHVNSSSGISIPDGNGLVVNFEP